MTIICTMVGVSAVRGVRGRAEKALQSWTVRSLMIGAVGSVVDLSVLLLTVKVLGFVAPLGAACGVALGAATNFTLNRRYSFKQDHLPFAGPAIRFAIGTAILTFIHAMVVSQLSNRFHAPLLVAKYSADVMVLLGGNLMLLRYVVFPKNAGTPAIAPAPAAAAAAAA
ncbi:MAG: GtrA family protein [Myxococcaceae bacterium]